MANENDRIGISRPDLMETKAGWGIKNNLRATTTPTVNDDSSKSYSVGSLWRDVITDTDEATWNLLICVTNKKGAARWEQAHT